MEEIDRLVKQLDRHTMPTWQQLLMRMTTRVHVATVRRFGGRSLEWFLGTVLAAMGATLLWHGDTFALAPYVFIREIAAEETWGTIFIIIGLARLAALIINGLIKHGMPHIRILLSLLSLMVWVELAVGYVTAQVPSLMISFTVSAVLFEFINCYRTGFEAGVEDSN